MTRPSPATFLSGGSGRRFLLAAVAVLALAIRVAGIKSGLPSETLRLTTFHPDESVTFYCLERMDPAKLDFYPGMALSWGSFQIYLQGAVSKAMALAGIVKLGGREFLLANLQEADKLYVSGRLLAMLFGAAAVMVLYLIAGFFLGPGASLFAAFLFAVAYLPVYTCFFVRPDSFMLLWGLLSVYFAFRLIKEPSRANYAWSAVFIGLSAASKYPGGFFVFFIAWGHFYHAWRRKDAFFNMRRLALAASISAGVFLLVNPYFLIRFHDAMGHINTWFSIHDSGSPWKGYLDLFAFSLPLSLGWPLYILSLAGIPLLARDRTPYSAAALTFMALYALRFGALNSALFTYFLQIVVFLSISAARFASAVSSRRAGLLAAALVSAYSAAYTVYLKSFFWDRGTPAMASEWIAGNVPAGAAIAIPKNDIWTPPVIRQDDPPYKVTAAGTSQGTIADAFSALPSAAAGADYLVLAEPEYGPGVSGLSPGRRADIMRRILSDFEEIKSFDVPMSRFFVPFVTDFHMYQMKMKAPGIRIFARRKPGGGARSAA